ncbi:hypothetical protein [Haloterrigena salifodinae]|uniref:MYM-type domain-containing protein n=1 Tax=Haloterrigena salifodinae TaxID=2675099 RepID=A0A8T8E6V8_9EURY|nr:hypothetical protein [Haloterrigena salifodinae]QRV17212.1 hypothetical protein JMJ58_10200 [Haloterrigena salifodinae]
MGADCTYCGCDIERHEPVFVSEESVETPTSRFCNYGCLAAHIEEEGLTAGTTCEWQ